MVGSRRLRPRRGRVPRGRRTRTVEFLAASHRRACDGNDRPEVMEWCDENGIEFIFGLPGNAVLSRLVEAADDVRVRRAEAERRSYAAIPRPATAPNPGAASGAWRHGSR